MSPAQAVHPSKRIKRLEPSAPLTVRESDAAETISILSYNLLLPNPPDAQNWWVYKTYPPTLDAAHSDWSRRGPLLFTELLSSQADILCLQELNPASFQVISAELERAGYAGRLHPRGRFIRCATFWRRDRLCLRAERNGFRSLTLLLELAGRAEKVPLLTLNLHLSGGAKPAARLQQLAQALEDASTLARRHGLSPHQTPLLLAGDFNCSRAQGVLPRFLREGELGSSAREIDYPDHPLTRRGKRHHFAPLTSLYPLAYGDAVLPTFIGAALVDRFCALPPALTLEEADSPAQRQRALERCVERARGEAEDTALRSLLRSEAFEALRALFVRCTEGADRLDALGLERLVTLVNRGERRGPLYEHAQQQLKASPEGLTLESWYRLYLELFLEGLWWSVASDLTRGGIQLPESSTGARLYQATIDQLWFNAKLTPLALREPIDQEERRSLEACGWGLPNKDHPSDHLSIGGVFRLSLHSRS
ncbi:MAG: endonuclease/exonuclease/phosphatase family protein [Myxococcota bacterium]|nr:endonuclease/exonuclease/phosphatase family protein [Myxococcota bacterium]